MTALTIVLTVDGFLFGYIELDKSRINIVSVGAFDNPVTCIFEAIVDNETRKLLSLSPSRVIPVPSNADASQKTDLSVQTPPAFSVDFTSGPKKFFQSFIVEGSDTFVVVSVTANMVNGNIVNIITTARAILSTRFAKCFFIVFIQTSPFATRIKSNFHNISYIFTYKFYHTLYCFAIVSIKIFHYLFICCVKYIKTR